MRRERERKSHILEYTLEKLFKWHEYPIAPCSNIVNHEESHKWCIALDLQTGMHSSIQNVSNIFHHKATLVLSCSVGM